MIVNNFGDAGSQRSTDTTTEVDDDVSSETVVYNQLQPNIANSTDQTAGLKSPSFQLTAPQPHNLSGVTHVT